MPGPRLLIALNLATPSQLLPRCLFSSTVSFPFQLPGEALSTSEAETCLRSPGWAGLPPLGSPPHRRLCTETHTKALRSSGGPTSPKSTLTDALGPWARPLQLGRRAQGHPTAGLQRGPMPRAGNLASRAALGRPLPATPPPNIPAALSPPWHLPQEPPVLAPWVPPLLAPSLPLPDRTSPLAQVPADVLLHQLALVRTPFPTQIHSPGPRVLSASGTVLSSEPPPPPLLAPPLWQLCLLDLSGPRPRARLGPHPQSLLDLKAETHSQTLPSFPFPRTPVVAHGSLTSLSVRHPWQP